MNSHPQTKFTGYYKKKKSVKETIIFDNNDDATCV